MTVATALACTGLALFLALSASAFSAAARAAEDPADSFSVPSASATHPGYYRFPAVHGATIIFTAEGDLWTVGIQGGVAHRLTSNSGLESHAAISPDGTTVAFSAQYEGPTDVYTMPVDGGLPERRTWDGDALEAGWTPDGKVLCGRTAMRPVPKAPPYPDKSFRFGR